MGGVCSKGLLDGVETATRWVIKASDMTRVTGQEKRIKGGGTLHFLHW